MKSHLRSWTLISAVVFLACYAQSGEQIQKKGATRNQPAENYQYVGSDTCRSCHEDLYKQGFEYTAHFKTTLKDGHGCEACHGPGSAHVESGGDKVKIFSFKGKTPKEISERCLECHEYGEEHGNFRRSQHNINEVGCTGCHSPHTPREQKFLLIAKQPQLCFECHTESKQDFSRPFRHRVEQGLVQCTDCHNQHGGFLAKQVRATANQDQVCFKCHADKTGPFAFEHEPVKTEGCIACHQPHGSTNPRLLRRTQVSLLCLECHTFTQDSSVPAIPSFHNQSQKYQACTLCHLAVHGSNTDRFFFK